MQQPKIYNIVLVLVTQMQESFPLVKVKTNSNYLDVYKSYIGREKGDQIHFTTLYLNLKLNEETNN